MLVVIVLIVLIVILAAVAIAQYNGLVTLRNKLQESWRQVDVELNRRYDLVPNLVNTVQGSAKFEQATLENVVALRNQARALATSGDTTGRSQAEGELSRAIGNIMVTAEAYPELKSTAGFQQLQSQLAATEDRIANSRRYYNAIVGSYNTKTEAFPSSIFAGLFHFTKAGYFEADDPSIREAPTVDFGQLNNPGLPPQVGQVPPAGPTPTA